MVILELPQDKGDLLTNYAPDNPEDQIAVSRAMAPSDANLSHYVGKIIRVAGVVMNMAEFDDLQAAGEVVEKVYASIVLDDGIVIGTTGKAVMGQLAYLIGANPQGEFKPPIPFEVRQHPSKGPKQPYYSLRRVKEMPPKAAARK
jgi:hypothetical protein